MTPTELAGGRYQVERVLGLGGMAVVYLARDSELHRQVAIKVLADSVSADPDLRARFVREARFAARLSHQNIVSIYDTGEEGGVPYIVMEWVEGSTLEGLGPLTVEEVEPIARQVCQGLAHAHEAGLVHRDVKPQNLLLRDDGTLKITDFGIARAAHETSITQVGTLLGTLSYLAPEVAAGSQATERSDLYGLGATCYELLTGRPPRRIKGFDELLELQPVEPLGETPLEQVVMHCLEADPALRPASAREVLDELDAGPASARPDTARTMVMEPVAAPDTVRARGSRTGRGAAALVLAAGLLAAAGIALGLATTGDGDPSGAGVQGIPQGGDPAQDARDLANWLRENSEG